MLPRGTVSCAWALPMQCASTWVVGLCAMHDTSCCALLHVAWLSTLGCCCLLLACFVPQKGQHKGHMLGCCNGPHGMVVASSCMGSCCNGVGIHYGICFMHKNSSSSNAVVVSAVGCFLRVVAHAFYVCVALLFNFLCVTWNKPLLLDG